MWLLWVILGYYGLFRVIMAPGPDQLPNTYLQATAEETAPY